MASTFEKQIAYGKRRAAELEAILADPDAAKRLEQAVFDGSALMGLLSQRSNLK